MITAEFLPLKKLETEYIINGLLKNRKINILRRKESWMYKKGMISGLKDKNGKDIRIGDKVRLVLSCG